MKQSMRREEGQVLITVLILLALSLMTMAGLSTSTAVSIKTKAVVQKQARQYYDAETVLNNVVAWLQKNSTKLVYPFREANFSSSFSLGAPSVGVNEGLFFSTPTMIKGLGANSTKSIILSTNNDFGVPYFPPTQDVGTGAAFDAVEEFKNADFGGDSNARVVLVWARHTAGSYEPVFRVDVINGNNPDRGVHSFSYVFSTLVTSTASASFYGQDGFSTGSPNNICSSYQYVNSGGSWVRGAPRANCVVASNQSLGLKSIINGSAMTLLSNGISFLPPSGSVTGSSCAGAACHSIALPTFASWSTTCGATNQGDRTVSTNQTWTLAGGAASQKCWRDVSVGNNRVLTLNATNDSADPATANYAFHFRNLNIANNGSLRFANMPSGRKVTIFVETLSGGAFNGNQLLNTNNAPSQVVINITGNTLHRLNGTAMISAFIRAPLATVEILGNFNYYGSIHSKLLNVTGNATLGADENNTGTPVVSDMKLGLRKASQRYR